MREIESNGTRSGRHGRRGIRGAGRLLFGVLLLASAALGFGIRGDDVRRLRAFADAVERWQTNPDFRQVQREYVARGADAMRGRLCGVSGETIVMGFRSLPGLPLYLRAHESSAAHYRAFGRGELSAYLHLTSEQGAGDAVAMLEHLATREPLTDVEVVAFLNGFRLPHAIATDAGAIAGVRRLIQDTQSPPRAFVCRADVAGGLRRAIGADVDAVPRAEQARLLAALDDVVRARDAELWRTKQVSDFLGGIWAQGYGPVYVSGITWLMRIHTAARAVFAVAITWLLWKLVRSHRPRLAAVAVEDLDHGPLRAGRETK